MTAALSLGSLAGGSTKNPAPSDGETVGAQNEESGGEETYYFMSGRAQLPNSRFLPCTIDMIINLFAIPQVPVQSYTPVSENLGKVVHHHIIFCVYRI